MAQVHTPEFNVRLQKPKKERAPTSPAPELNLRVRNRPRKRAQKQIARLTEPITSRGATLQSNIGADFGHFADLIRNQAAARGAPEAGISSALGTADDALRRNLAYIQRGTEDSEQYFRGLLGRGGRRFDGFGGGLGLFLGGGNDFRRFLRDDDGLDAFRRFLRRFD